MHQVLGFLEREAAPVGANALCYWLRQGGKEISPATVGRLLRELDVQNLTQRVGQQGRVLTEKGHAVLIALRHERAVASASDGLVRALKTGTALEFIDVLVARRGLEREMARLAAEFATTGDIDTLDELADRYNRADQMSAMAESDFAFHVRLADASRNKIMQSGTHLIRAQSDSFAIPASLYRNLKPLMAPHHREIVKAIKARDPGRAERSMVAHFDDVINAVSRHARQVNFAP
ncbi:MAG TPA: FCD domain-containing protein [Symbiobacteriaceae bacterium]|jgi:GntR family L-lactate dehydrogenase operon transcriptional regulator